MRNGNGTRKSGATTYSNDFVASNSLLRNVEALDWTDIIDTIGRRRGFVYVGRWIKICFVRSHTFDNQSMI